MKEKLYKGKTLQEVEELVVADLGVCKDDLYFDILSADGAPVEETEINREFNKSIENLDFEYAHNWLLVSEELRKLVFYTSRY